MASAEGRERRREISLCPGRPLCRGRSRIDRRWTWTRKGGDVEQDVFVRLHAQEGEGRAVEEALREEAGCLSFHTFRSVRDPRLFYIHSRWVDEAAFQRHADLEHPVRFLKRVDALLDEPRNVTRTEMME
jgi:quinol monooxygenase YgiN